MGSRWQWWAIKGAGAPEPQSHRKAKARALRRLPLGFPLTTAAAECLLAAAMSAGAQTVEPSGTPGSPGVFHSQSPLEPPTLAATPTATDGRPPPRRPRLPGRRSRPRHPRPPSRPIKCRRWWRRPQAARPTTAPLGGAAALIAWAVPPCCCWRNGEGERGFHHSAITVQSQCLVGGNFHPHSDQQIAAEEQADQWQEHADRRVGQRHCTRRVNHRLISCATDRVRRSSSPAQASPITASTRP